MAVNIRLIFLILGFLALCASTAGIPSRVNLQSLGLALWLLAIILG